MNKAIGSIARGVMPNPLYRWFRGATSGEDETPSVGSVDFGSLRRLTPISQVFGFDRGTPVDRYYIENFLACNASDIRGTVLEVGDDSYTRRFGGGSVTHREVLHVMEGNPQATIVADLAAGENIPSDTFDCIILTQTLQFIYDLKSAILTLHRILRPGGVLLATMPGISQIDHNEWHDSWYWSLTKLSARRLFAGVFSPDSVEIEAHGNVLAAIALLQGIALEELRVEELDKADPDYQLIITVRASKESAV
jgi:SAM-dependent methyltransferase